MTEDRFCAACGALLAPDAKWCGLCLAPVAAAPPAPAPAAPTELAPAPPVEADSAIVPVLGSPTAASDAAPIRWACSVCGEENSFDLTFCSVCGAPFARLFDDPSMTGERLSTSEATRYGLVPGWGLLKQGHNGEGGARMVVSAGSLLLFLLFVLGGAGGGFSKVLLVVLSAACTFGLVGESVFESRRVAQGGSIAIQARYLAWALGGLLLIAVLLVFSSSLSAGETS